MEFGKFFPPMLLEEEKEPFDSEEFLYELKFDGIRATIHVGTTFFKIFSRRGVDITEIYPELKSIQKLVTENTIFDGEIVLFDSGKPSFTKLQERSHAKNKKKISFLAEENPVCFMAFDVVYKNKSLVDCTLLKRKEILMKHKENNAFIKVNYILKEGKKLFQKIQKIELEGIVAKKIESTYQINTRSRNWIKIKNWQEEIFFIGGYTVEEKEPMIKLFLGEYKNNKLYFVGKVMASKKNPIFKKIVKEKIKKTSSFCNFEEEINYIKPKLTCDVSYIERTKTNHLRQAVFKKECTNPKK